MIQVDGHPLQRYNLHMPYLVDGHNLIGQMDELSLQDIDDEQSLIEILQDFCRREKRQVEVYFDNAPPGGRRVQSFGRVTAFFSRAGKSADQAIYERLQRLGKDARNWTVVSSDHQVQAMAKSLNARVIPSSEFAHLIHGGTSQTRPTGKEPEEKINPDDRNLDEWLRLFGGC
jgi:predicted RNA-binding protein with PIN domain